MGDHQKSRWTVIRQRIEARGSQQATPAADRPPDRTGVTGQTDWDRALTRLSLVGQIVLVVVAVFGYFHTVVPVYQKEKLSEDISRQQLELEALRLEATTFRPELERLVAEKETLLREIQIADAKRVESEAAAETAQRRMQKARSELETLDKKLKAAQASADSAFEEIYRESFRGSVFMTFLAKLARSSPRDVLKRQEPADIESFLVTPFEVISKVLESGDSRYLEAVRVVPEETRRRIHESVRRQLLAQKHELGRPDTDIRQILVKYNREMEENAVDPTPSDRFNEAQYKVQERYSSLLFDSQRVEQQRAAEFLDQVAK